MGNIDTAIQRDCTKPSPKEKDSTETFVGRGASSWESWELSKSRVYEKYSNSR